MLIINFYCFKNDQKLWSEENYALREKCPNTKLFLVRIFLHSVRMQENKDQK